MTQPCRIMVALAAALALLPCRLLAQAAPPGRPGDAQQLIGVLQGPAGQFEKARACQQLAILGAKEAVPALAALLGDPQLGTYARDGLEGIADPSALAALRKATKTLLGGPLLGVVGSLGAKRDVQAVPLLARMSGSSDADLAVAALGALGRIANVEAASALSRALATGPKALRQPAADAALQCADRMISEGHPETAISLLSRVGKAAVPPHLRLAAIRDLMVAQWKGGSVPGQKAAVALLLAQLRSPDAAAVTMALRATRYMPGAGVTTALAGEVQRAQPRVQARIVQALVERGDAGALPVIESLAGSGSAGARSAALAALGTIGRLSSVPVLTKSIEGAATDEEAAGATESLVRLTVAGVDTAIIERLAGTSPAARARLVAVLGKRRAPASADAVLKAAGDPDPAVRKAAFVALVALSRAGDLAEVVRMAVASGEESTRESAASAVHATASRLPDPGSRSAPLIAAMAKADAPARCRLVRMLGDVGGLQALKAVREALDGTDATVRDAALESLAGWPDPSAVPALLGAMESSTNPATRARALRGAVGLSGALAAELPTPSPQLVGWLARACKAVGADAGERRLILAALADLKCRASLLMIQRYMGDANVEAEAVAALARLAGQLAGDDQRMARWLLEKAAAGATGEAVRAQAAAAVAKVPGDSLELKVVGPSGDLVSFDQLLEPALPTEADVAKLAFAPIFDGTTFAGWEGDTSKAFRIEQDAIVGGSLAAPVARNEFLCTVRPYANFVLKLECRLKSANGGVQLRSRRVPDSAEVSGYQADMDSGGQYWGCLYDESRRGMLVQADQAKMLPIVKKDDWNDYEIRCEGPRIRLYVNGVQTVDYTEKDGDILHSGIIAVQVHGGPPSETWYRNIRIAELP